MLTRINTATAGLSGSPTGTPNSSRFGFRNSYFENAADTDSSLNEEEPTEDDEESQEWGLAKGMELFEVSAKDDTGKCDCGPALVASSADNLPSASQVSQSYSILSSRQSPFERATWIRKMI